MVFSENQGPFNIYQKNTEVQEFFSVVLQIRIYKNQRKSNLETN